MRVPAVLSSVLLTVLVGGTAGAGCDTGTGDYDCAHSGVYVDWGPLNLPTASRARVCVDGDCEDTVRPAQGTFSSASAPAVSEGRVSVRLELFDGSGEIVASVQGEGNVEGGCCGRHLFMRTKSDGRGLEPARR